MIVCDVEVPAATCSCGVRLHAVSNHDGSDWVWVDDEGQSLVSRHPPGYREDPKGWWDRLAREDIAAYSDLSARFALGMTGWLHSHRPAHPDRFVDDVPWCCEMPMRLTPRGWVCRETTH